uniref:Pyrrolo-quinoline quinone repeat domain-containing protein n=1 Tax=Schlesneria paludicola TaxID=360056 RepID=A0A7C2K2J5_9PLAN
MNPTSTSAVGSTVHRWVVRAALPAAALVGIGLSIWHAGQFEIRPTGEGTPFLLADPQPGHNDWPGWRGPLQQGVVESEFLPPPSESTGWTEVWRTPWAAIGRSGPCVWGDRVFATGFDPDRLAIVLACFHRVTGALKWQTAVETNPDRGLPADRQALATPACDGERVFVPVMADGEMRMAAVFMDGRMAWTQTIGPAHTRQGIRTSPCVFGPLVIVAQDEDGRSLFPGQSGSYLAALHRQTGELVYRISRPKGESAGIPVAAEIAGRPQLVLTGRNAIRSYNPASGQELWRCHWKVSRTEGSVAWDDEHIYAVSGTADGELICIRADGDGDVTETHVVWRERRPGQAALSPLVTQVGVLVLARDGQLTAVNRATGKLLWQKRSLGTCSTPPWRVGTQGVCVITDEGTVALLNAVRRGEVLWETSLGVPVGGPAAVSGGRLIVRTPGGLLMTGGSSRETLVQQPPTDQQPL